MSLRGRPTTVNGQRSRNLSKQRADYFPRKAFRVEGKQINFNNTMKMKKTMISLCALLLVGTVSMMTAAAAKLAVLVVGLETDAASDAFATGIRYEFTQKGYELVNNDAVKAKLTALRTLHAQEGTVDTVGLAAWGKENGLDFVQLVVESDCSIIIGNSAPVNGREQLSQVVSCSTAKYTGRLTYRTRFVPHSGANPNLGTEFEEMVYVAGGVFEMGCKSDRDGTCRTGETPVHWVKVNNFYIGKYAVTQALWKKVMGSLPSSISGNSLGDDKPMVYVTWNDITSPNGFLATLNAQTGKNYRLPTEAEWEYAARGCNNGVCENFMYSGSNTINDVAWWQHSYLGRYPHPVGKKLPNGLGLYDMTGNTWDWCSDWYSASYYPSGTSQSSPQNNPTGPSSPNSTSERVLRGGNVMWCYEDFYNRIACRKATPDGSNDAIGFRLVLP
jgi:formylglycine-generating enzyme required for sulfatase activity